MQRPTVDRTAIDQAFLADEYTVLASLLQRLEAVVDDDVEARITVTARQLSLAARKAAVGLHAEAWPALYRLGGNEGKLLLALAEALPRVPDDATALALLQDKLGQGRWRNTQREGLLALAVATGLGIGSAWANSNVGQTCSPLLLKGARLALGRASQLYVYAQTISQALRRWRASPGTPVSFDMLGEAAITHAQADAFYQAYQAAIASIDRETATRPAAKSNISVSVKLSALTPRFELAQHRHVMAEVLPRLHALALTAKAAGIGLTVDAEEADRLTLTLEVFEQVAGHADLAGWNGLGLAVQAYQKRALPLLDYLMQLARQLGRRIPVRLVKGAYWDTEIKLAQLGGWRDFPVFTHKCATDVSYLACARHMLAASAWIYPQFATHNAHTVAYLLALQEQPDQFEFQRLHGMGGALYDQVLRSHGVPCRVYAPIGPAQDLLPYLVRRLLENGANSSFVNQLADAEQGIESLISDPRTAARAVLATPRTVVRSPSALYAPERRNSAGNSLSDTVTWAPLWAGIQAQIMAPSWSAAPVIAGQRAQGTGRAVHDPAARDRQVGSVVEADATMAERALAVTGAAWEPWAATPVSERSACLERAADQLARQRPRFMAMLLREAGKCAADALGECREAEDLLRFYAAEARRLCEQPLALPGPVGERNTLSLHARGTFLCISPWNFPLAIYLGQVAAALVTGNTVIAKPAEQTPLIAAAAMEVLLAAGVPPAAVALLPGPGPVLGAQLLADARIAGVCFTGSTATARQIQQALAARPGPLVPLIAETGGINALIADSTAHPEQLVRDVLTSAFNSAGQRCSALRLLLVQEDVAADIYALLGGAMATLQVGSPTDLATDIGPLIDADALADLRAHVARLEREGRCLGRATLPAEHAEGCYLAPCAYVIPGIEWLQEETFGPVLHVVSYRRTELDNVITALNAKRYGLTLGIQSRMDATIQYISQRLRVGNIYVNRNMIGAVVGSQPFGGENLSGTGPKAGGPHYLMRFCTERCLSVNTVAIGGDADLLGDGS